MQANFYLYTFGDLEFDSENQELFRNRDRVPLTATETKILIWFIEHSNEAISVDDFLSGIWGTDTFPEEGNVRVHIHHLRQKLGGERDKFIITGKEPGSYIFVEAVKRRKKPKDYSISKIFDEEETEEAKEEEFHSAAAAEPIIIEKEPFEKTLEFGWREKTGQILGWLAAGGFFLGGYYFNNCYAECFEKSIFMVFAASFYAILTGIGILLECAYEFDKYGWRAIKIITPAMGVAAGAMFAALSFAEYLLPEDIGFAFVGGSMLLISGAGGTCLLAWLVLPSKPITAAKITTQSAIAAFCKNIFLYFFTIYTVFGLLIFCLLNSYIPAFKSVAYPISFLVVWIIIALTSHFSTTYLLQNLRTEKDGAAYKYHGLFSTLIIFRQVFLLGGAFISVLYYFITCAITEAK